MAGHRAIEADAADAEAVVPASSCNGSDASSEMTNHSGKSAPALHIA